MVAILQIGIFNFLYYLIMFRILIPSAPTFILIFFFFGGYFVGWFILDKKNDDRNWVVIIAGLIWFTGPGLTLMLDHYLFDRTLTGL